MLNLTQERMLRGTRIVAHGAAAHILKIQMLFRKSKGMPRLIAALGLAPIVSRNREQASEVRPVEELVLKLSHPKFLADVPHRQWVFTIPKRLRVYFRYDRSLLGKLCRAAYDTLREVFKLRSTATAAFRQWSLVVERAGTAPATAKNPRATGKGERP